MTYFTQMLITLCKNQMIQNMILDFMATKELSCKDYDIEKTYKARELR